MKPFNKELLTPLGWPYILFVLCLFVILVVSHIGFEGGNWLLIPQVPGHCLPDTFLTFEMGFLCFLEISSAFLRYSRHCGLSSRLIPSHKSLSATWFSTSFHDISGPASLVCSSE